MPRNPNDSQDKWTSNAGRKGNRKQQLPSRHVFFLGVHGFLVLLGFLMSLSVFTNLSFILFFFHFFLAPSLFLPLVFHNFLAHPVFLLLFPPFQYNWDKEENNRGYRDK